MRVPRAVSLGLVTLVATPWAAALTIGGLWLCMEGTARWPAFAEVVLVSGVTLAAAGQHVFLACVADRIFPAGARFLGPWIELPICLIVLLGAGAMVWLGMEALWSVDSGG